MNYCTAADVQRYLSTTGADLWADSELQGQPNPDVYDDVIEQASAEIDLYAQQRYSAASLATSSIISRWCTTIACYFLTIRRGNPPPESLAGEFLRLTDPDTGILARIAKGLVQLPGLALRADLRPRMSNIKIDRRYVQSKQRVEKETSTDAETKLRQNLMEEVPSRWL